MKFLLVIMIIILLNAFFIVSNNNLKLDNSENVKELGVIYLNWINKITDNAREITGSVAKLDWAPESEEKASAEN